MTLTIVADNQPNRQPSPDGDADNQPEIFTLPDHVIATLEKRYGSSAERHSRATNQPDRQDPHLSKNTKPST